MERPGREPRGEDSSPFLIRRSLFSLEVFVIVDAEFFEELVEHFMRRLVGLMIREFRHELRGVGKVYRDVVREATSKQVDE